MKKILNSLFFFIVIFMVFGSCATDKMTYISKDYELYGTWVNPDYTNGRYHPKIIINPNGKVDFYRLISDTEINSQGELVITNKWIEARGMGWYTFILRPTINSTTWWYAFGICQHSFRHEIYKND